MNTQTLHVDHTMYASQSKRFGNFIIDTIASYVVVIVLSFIVGLVTMLLEYDDFIIWLENIDPIQDVVITTGLRLLYYIVMEAAFQRTIGKIITGTKVVQYDGSKPDLGTIGVRTLCRLIPFEQFSFLGGEARGWHDSISKTYVIDIKKYEAELYLKTSLEELGKEEEVA